MAGDTLDRVQADRSAQPSVDRLLEAHAAASACEAARAGLPVLCVSRKFSQQEEEHQADEPLPNVGAPSCKGAAKGPGRKNRQCLFLGIRLRFVGPLTMGTSRDSSAGPFTATGMSQSRELAAAHRGSESTRRLAGRATPGRSGTPGWLPHTW